MLVFCLGGTWFKSTQCSYVTLHNIVKGIRLVEYQQRSRPLRFLVIISVHTVIQHVDFKDNGKVSIPDSIQNYDYVLLWA